MPIALPAHLSTASFVHGFGLSLGLVAAIGPQNAHVLRTGLLRRHVGATVALCVVADLLLIGLGLAGVSELLSDTPLLATLGRWGAVVLLGLYALRSLRDACCTAASLNGHGGAMASTLRAALAATAWVTFANPGVYLETLLLIGAAALDHGEHGRWLFGLGALSASAAWFAALGFGARAAAPWLARPGAWRTLNVLNAVVMAACAARLAGG